MEKQRKVMMRMSRTYTGRAGPEGPHLDSARTQAELLKEGSHEGLF